jgi:hypothetical protein
MVTFDRLAVGLVFVAVCTLACLSPAQGDTWWHLRAGLDIWRTHSISLVDTYSYTAAGRVFPNHEWLTQAVFYGLYRIGGMPLLEATCAAAIVFAWAVAWRLAEDGTFEVKLVALLASIAASTVSWALRPQAISMALLMVTISLLASKRVRLLPLLFLVWANLHGAVALGVLAILAALLATAVQERRVPTALSLSALGCIVATCLTPLGFRYWPEILASIERSQADGLIEWSMPGLQPVMWGFWAMAVWLVIATIVFRRRLAGRTVVLVAVAFALLPLAVRSIRNVPMFMLVATPAISALARSPTATRQRTRATSERTGLNAAILGLAATIAGFGVALAWSEQIPPLGWQPLSPAAIGAISACPDPIYNTYEGGGALIWFVPGKKVFIDNRQDPYPSDLLVAARQVESDGRYQALFAQYGIRCATMPTNSVTAANLRADAGWMAVHDDARVSVFVRR